MTNPSQHILPQSLSMPTAQVALELALPAHNWEDRLVQADATAGVWTGLHSHSRAGFLLVVGHGPQVMGVGAICTLTPWSFFLQSVFSTTTRVILSCFTRLPALPGAYRVCSRVSGMASKAWHPGPNCFSMSPPAPVSGCTLWPISPLVFINPVVPFRLLCLCACSSFCPERPSPLH